MTLLINASIPDYLNRLFCINHNLSCGPLPLAFIFATSWGGAVISATGWIDVLITNLLYTDPQAFDHNDVSLLKRRWGCRKGGEFIDFQYNSESSPAVPHLSTRHRESDRESTVLLPWWKSRRTSSNSILIRRCIDFLTNAINIFLSIFA